MTEDSKPISIDNAKRYLRYLSINARKYGGDMLPSLEVHKKIHELEKKNMHLYEKMQEIENKLSKPRPADPTPEQVVPSSMFVPQTAKSRKEELEMKIQDKLDTLGNLKKTRIADDRLAQMEEEKKGKRRKEIEEKIQARFLEEKVGPLKLRLSQIQGTYNKLSRHKNFRDKKKKLAQLKATIDRLKEKISQIRYP